MGKNVSNQGDPFKRKKGSDKSRETYKKYGKYSQKSLRIKNQTQLQNQAPSIDSTKNK